MGRLTQENRQSTLQSRKVDVEVQSDPPQQCSLAELGSLVIVVSRQDRIRVGNFNKKNWQAAVRISSYHLLSPPVRAGRS